MSLWLFFKETYFVGVNCSSVWSCRFTYTEDPNYGPYLKSVNGLAGSDKDRTYWELFVKTPDGKIIRPNVGESTRKIAIDQSFHFIVNQIIIHKMDLVCRHRMLHSQQKWENHSEIFKVVNIMQMMCFNMGSESQRWNRLCIRQRVSVFNAEWH